MSETTYYQRNREVILNKEILREKVRNKYGQLSEQEKAIKTQYGRSRYQNMSDKNKQELKEYQRNYRRSRQAK